MSPQSREKMMVCVHFGDQRFRSAPVSCCVNPAFDEDFMIELNLEDRHDLHFDEASAILQMNTPIHLVVIRQDEEGRYHFVGGHMLEWRKVLKRGVIMMSVELGGGAGYEMTVPKGLLEIRLELVPKPSINISENEIANQVNIEKNRETQAEREFYIYSKQWYEEYQQIRESHKSRVVKLYAEAENGNTRPVVAFVTPLRADRLLDSPSTAARFVSCIAHEQHNPALSGTTKEIWWTNHAFLCKQSGCAENHSILLCSLFLGFKLDAYVCIGTDNKGPKVWVMTKSSDGKVSFWDSVNGTKYGQHSENHHFQTIGCLFNHENFFANIQKTDSISNCIFDLDNESMWKSMSRMKLGLVKRFPRLPLCPPIGNAYRTEEDTELQLKKLIESSRKDLGLSTSWDEEMGYILTPALQSYELSSISNIASHTIMAEFQECVKNTVPDGHTFKGFPIQLNHTNSKRILAACLRHRSFKDILECVGDQIRFGIRVRIFPYPESVSVVWLIIACIYRPVE